MKPTHRSLTSSVTLSSASACCTAALALALGSTAHAINWTAGAVTDVWSTASNWGGTVPNASNVSAVIVGGGTATISDGNSFVTGDTIPGNSSAGGYVAQDGGSLEVNGWLKIASATTAVGGYNISGGSLSVPGGRLIIGNGGVGTLTVSGSAAITTGASTELWIGQGGVDNNSGTTGNGTLDMSGGTLAANSWMSVGRGGGTGVMNLSGGTFTKNSSAALLFGDGNGATGTLNLSGTGTLNSAAVVRVASGNGSTGTINMTGGTLVLTNEFWISNGSTANGVMNLSNGTFNAGSWFAVGRDGGTGTLNMTGGTLNKTGNGNINLGAGGGANNSRGTLNQSAGTINAAHGPDWQIAEVGGGEGTYNLSGSGVGNFLKIRLGHDATGTGTINLNGGTLTATQIEKNAAGTATGTFNFNGGTLSAGSGAAPAFMTGLTRANVHNGGAVIDTNSQDITIAQDLLHSNLGGANATDGGLVKNGSGNLTLGGANSYNGGTTVNGGTITAGSTSAFGSGNVTVNASATLDFANNAVANNVTNNGGTLVNAVNLAVNQTGGSVTGSIAGGTLNGSIAGSFSASGSVAGTPTITGTLKGTATFTGAITFDNGSTHSPGNSPGIETFASGVTYLSGSTLEIELVGDTLAIRGTDYDGVNVTGGDLTIQSGAILSVIDLGSFINYAAPDWDSPRVFTLVDSSGGGTTTGDFTLDTSLAGAFAGQGTWSLLTASGLNGDTVLTWTPVPEPSTYAALAGLAVLGLALRRRSKATAAASL